MPTGIYKRSLKEQKRLRLIGKLNRIHGEADKSTEYSSWKHMIERCTNRSCKDYKYYGGRGITVCYPWTLSKRQGYMNFLKDVGRKPSSKYTLDRINNEGNYNPTNCRWATKFEQNRNRRCCNVN